MIFHGQVCTRVKRIGLEITVYDHDVGKDDFMGRYVPGSDK